MQNLDYAEPRLYMSHALATTKNYIRETQIRLILDYLTWLQLLSSPAVVFLQVSVVRLYKLNSIAFI